MSAVPEIGSPPSVGCTPRSALGASSKISQPPPTSLPVKPTLSRRNARSASAGRIEHRMHAANHGAPPVGENGIALASARLYKARSLDEKQQKTTSSMAASAPTDERTVDTAMGAASSIG